MPSQNIQSLKVVIEVILRMCCEVTSPSLSAPFLPYWFFPGSAVLAFDIKEFAIVDFETFCLKN